MQSLPVRDRGYANPELLAETDCLADRLTGPTLRVIDARHPEQYTTNHVPGAVNLSGFGGIPRATNGDMASPDEFASLVGNLGISNDMTVVVYDAPSQMMGMVAWAFLYYGHLDVRILDGGFAKWSREHRPISNQGVDYPSAIFVPKPQEALYCSLDQAKTAVFACQRPSSGTLAVWQNFKGLLGPMMHQNGWVGFRARPISNGTNVRPGYEDAEACK